MAWLSKNGPFLVGMFAVIALIVQFLGLEGLWKCFLVAVGLGFVIFIHELGHFLAAKWCDVHVTTFSIGFGPALPGCSFQHGETTYKLALLPLGGYVNMVGEAGLEGEENEDYPRSFKNKSVGQRMLIISAGVVMNVILGCICFLIVYRGHGVERPVAAVWRTDPGSPAWNKGVRTGSIITGIAGKSDPYFDDLRRFVALSSAGVKIPFELQPRLGEKVVVELEPRCDANDFYPVIGVAAPLRVKLWPRDLKKYHELPVSYGSPASFARAFDLQPGDVVVAASNPDHGDKVEPLNHDLSGRTFDAAELCRRMRGLGDRVLKIEVVRPGAPAGEGPRLVEVPAAGFDFDDQIVGTTDPARPAELFTLKELPPDPITKEDDARDPFEFRDRLKQMAGLPMVIQVRRGPKEAPPVSLLVPPAFHYSVGLQMKMGEVAAVRENSPAARAGIRPAAPGVPGDVLKKIEVVAIQPAMLPWWGDQPVGAASVVPMADPTRIPYELSKLLRARQREHEDNSKVKVKVRITVLRPNPGSHRDQEDHVLPLLDWDSSWDYAEETPVSPVSPMAISQLGLAYRITSTVEHVQENSPAARAGLQVNDVVEQIRFRSDGKKLDSPGQWGQFTEMASNRGPNQKKVFDQWADYFTLLQLGDYHEIEIKVNRQGALLPEPIKLAAVVDDKWPLEERGLVLQAELKLQKAHSLLEALDFGVQRTWSDITQILSNLNSLIRGRISTKAIGGPIEIAAQTFAAAEDPYTLILILGVISVNLAVVNFLPIPLLDGGHMVFLIYEKLRGKRPSQAVENAALWIGLLFLLGLMLFVVYQDVMRRIVPWFFP
jgi:membrane-associated protease RseP (regulator of RpoE activity)